MLRYSASNAQGAIISQGVINLMLEEKSEPTPAPAGNYDYTFPDNLKSYTAGTKVMQPKNGKVYQCRPFPYSGYCVQWSQHASQYEPGDGLDRSRPIISPGGSRLMRIAPCVIRFSPSQNAACLMIKQPALFIMAHASLITFKYFRRTHV